MRKNYYYLLFIFIIASCDSKEDLPSTNQSTNYPQQLYIINGDIKCYANITDGSKPKAPIFIYDIPEKTKEDITYKTTSKTSEQSTFINFDYGIADSTKSGCTFDKYNQSSGTYTTTDAGVYGHNPAPQDNGYLVRGYGVPYHNQYYNALILQTTNKAIKRTDTRTNVTINDNLPTIAAISIEFPFKANVTYEISLKTLFIDNNLLIGTVASNGYPTLHAALQDSGILFGGITTCEKTSRQSGIAENYIKSYTLENNIKKERIITYKFSPTEAKNALAFILRPHTGGRGVDVKIPTNNYTMRLRTVTITEKPFDPSLNITGPRPPGR